MAAGLWLTDGGSNLLFSVSAFPASGVEPWARTPRACVQAGDPVLAEGQRTQYVARPAAPPETRPQSWPPNRDV